MSLQSRVVWTEGLFLRPQHFQQQDRYHESYVQARCRALRPFAWGFQELEVDNQLLKLGKVAISHCLALMPDGTPLTVPDVDAQPEVMELSAGVKSQLVYLGLPVRRSGATEYQLDEAEQTPARYQAREMDVHDSASEHSDKAAIQVGQLRMRLLLEEEDRSGYVVLPLLRISEVHEDGEIVVDAQFIPPLLDVRQHPALAGILSELSGLLHQRGEALAGRLRDSGRSGTAEVADLLMLQLVNRLEPRLNHLSQVQPLHPQELYLELLSMAGELATYTRGERRPGALPEYRQGDLEHCFGPLLGQVRQSLSTVLEQSAVALQLVERKYGIRVSPIGDRSLLESATFVLAVKADMAGDQLAARLPGQVKIAPVERIRELVNMQLPGIGLHPLPVAPRQIPYHAGFVYFQLDKRSDLWRGLKESGGFALHLGADFPGLELEFWAIRN